MPGHLRNDVLAIAHVMETDSPLPCLSCGELLPYAIRIRPEGLGEDDLHEHRVVVFYPYINSPLLDWQDRDENMRLDVPFFRLRWIPLVDATLAPETRLYFFAAGFLKDFREQPNRYSVVGSKVDQNLVMSDFHAVVR